MDERKVVFDTDEEKARVFRENEVRREADLAALAKVPTKDGDRKERRAAEQREAEAKARAELPQLSKEHEEFNRLVDGLYRRVADMQLRPADTLKFAETCEAIKVAYAAK